MKLLPFRRRPAPPVESRQQGPYTDAITAAILASATGQAGAASVQQTAAVEIAAGLIGRAFAAAKVEGSDLADPSTLAAIGRDMVTVGQALYVVTPDRTELLPVSSHDIQGGARRESWRYSLEMPTPGGGEMRGFYDWMSVLHARYSYDAVQPWIGIGPLARAKTGADLAAQLEGSLRDESGTTVGYLLPIPTDGADASVTALKQDLGRLRGKTSVVETTSGGWGDGRLSAPRHDYMPQRLGPAPPDATVKLHAASTLAVLGMCGVPIELLQNSDGTSQREAWRRFLHGTLQPLSMIIARELSRLAGRPVTISHAALFASDIAGRARAFQSLVGSGMSLQDAAAQTGLLNPEEGG